MSTFAAASAAAWTAPVILTFDRVAAAVGSAAGPTVTGGLVHGSLVSGQSLRPNSVTWSSNVQSYLFEEQCVILASPQNTDSGMVLPAGVQITSHLVHYSPTSGTRTLVGGASFPGTIVGYDWQDASLTAGDATWGVPGVNYGSSRRRMEWPGNDTITFTLPGDVSLALYCNRAYADQIRIYVVY